MQERFWGWSENKREEEKDLAELSQLAKDGKPLYGESHQSPWVQGTAHRNSVFSQLKFCASPIYLLCRIAYRPSFFSCVPNVSATLFIAVQSII